MRVTVVTKMMLLVLVFLAMTILVLDITLSLPSLIEISPLILYKTLRTDTIKQYTSVLRLLPTGSDVTIKCPKRFQRPLPSTMITLSEINLAGKCFSNYANDFKGRSSPFWKGNTRYIRHTFHKYLNKDSVIMEVGGNVGWDARNFIRLYNPTVYIIMEPIKYFYRGLKDRFKDKPNVLIYNLGLGYQDQEFMVNVKGHDGVATSAFDSDSSTPKHRLKVVNTTEFLLKLGVGCFDIDLLTINCEGCEFDILESIIESNIVLHIKHLQFATHSTLKNIERPEERYCKIQELLKRTHTLSYQYKFIWESWTIKN